LKVLRRLYRQAIPGAIRATIRRVLTDLPHRVVDFVPDVLSRKNEGQSVPPAALRARVARSSSRREFVRVGRELALSIRGLLDESGVQPGGRWLDFGCGCGRVARSLLAHVETSELVGVDPDHLGVVWCQKNLDGRFLTSSRQPPLALDEGFFDVAVVVSVFTHLDEEAQLAWLRELRRVLRPGGVLLASTHSPELTFMRPDLSEAEHQTLQEKGFLFAAGHGRFNDDGAFHTEGYLDDVWGGLFERLLFKSGGLDGFQDVSVWRKNE
jgi:SAM-dependent methyltransferase